MRSPLLGIHSAVLLVEARLRSDVPSAVTVKGTRGSSGCGRRAMRAG